MNCIEDDFPGNKVIDKLNGLVDQCESRIIDLRSFCEEMKSIIETIKSDRLMAISKVANVDDKTDFDINHDDAKATTILKLEQELRSSRQDVEMLFSQLNELMEFSARKQSVNLPKKKTTFTKIFNKAKKILRR